MTSLVDSSSIADDGPQRSHVAGPSEAGRSSSGANVTAKLIMAGPGGDEEPDTEPAEDPAVEPDADLSGETGAGQPADRGDADGTPSHDQAAQVTGGTPTEPEPDPTPSEPTIEPELSDTGETDEHPTSEPDSSDSPEPETPEDETDTDDGTCLGVNALGLTVDLCLLSLLG